MPSLIRPPALFQLFLREQFCCFLTHPIFPPPFSLLHFVLQAKVAEELAAATAQVSQLQLELTAHQKKEMDLRKQLSCAVQDAERQEAQLNKLQAQVAGEAAPACP